MKVFLSGGTRNAWHDRVKSALPGHTFFDPRTLGKLDMRTIAETERRWLDECDVLFFYLEHDNPSGLGSAFEVGYCVANGKPVIFVDERRNSHTEWLGVHCNHVTLELQAGIEVLGKLLES